MSLHAIAAEEPLKALHTGTVDNLVIGYFDKAFLAFNLFVDDPRTCLHLSENVFRQLTESGEVSEQAFYRNLAAMVSELPEKNALLADVEADSVLCWLLKDSAERTYAEIAAAMGIDRDAVRTRIAEVRMALLG